MEEYVGQLWHRLVSRAAHRGYKNGGHRSAAVELSEVRATAGVMFRALGGDGGLRLEAATATEHGARRRWLQRIAGTHKKVELAWRNDAVLHLPGCIDLFSKKSLNRELYLWLAALAASDDLEGLPRLWSRRNQWLVNHSLSRYPGLRPRYERLLRAQLALRPDPNNLRADEAALETAIQLALRKPGSVEQLPSAGRAPQPVYLWLYPCSNRGAADTAIAMEDSDEPQHSSENLQQGDRRRRSAERTEMPKSEDGLLAARWESIFSWSEYVKVDRPTDEDDDPNAAQVAEDMAVLSVARDNKPAASRIRFDLDLPAPEYDDLPLGEGVSLPEWDYRRRTLRPDRCRLQPMVARDAQPCELPQHLRRTARRLRGQFEALAQTRTWLRGQEEGTQVDLDAYLSYLAEKRQGEVGEQRGLYRECRVNQRDLACLLLADLSLSTDTWVDDESRVIDVIRDSLFLFSEVLAATGDSFAIHGFSSRNRNHIRFHTLKAFIDSYSALTRGRIQAIKPGYYTRMGAAIRHATNLLVAQPATRQLLLLLTDGKPNDLDHYEGRYGVEDTKMAVLEARRQGLYPFCVTVDRKAADYLPHLFGPEGYVVIRRPRDLPFSLPLLYARLTS